MGSEIIPSGAGGSGDDRDTGDRGDAGSSIPGGVTGGGTAGRISDGLSLTLRRLASLAGGLVVVTAVVSIATFATGWWAFGTSTAWIILGGVLCLVPVLAALGAWAVVRAGAHYAGRLVVDIAAFLRGPTTPAAQVLIDYDSGQPVVTSSRRMAPLRTELEVRKRDLPALWLGVRAITVVPGLAAIAVLGMMAVGILGTLLLLGQLF